MNIAFNNDILIKNLFPNENPTSDDVSFYLQKFDTLDDQTKEISWEYLYQLANKKNVPIPENSQLYRYITTNNTLELSNNAILRDLNNIMVSNNNDEKFTYEKGTTLNNAITNYLLKINYFDQIKPYNILILFVYAKMTEENEEFNLIAKIKVQIFTMDLYSTTVLELYEENILNENTEKLNLKDSDYGVPSLKKYPIYDKEHVLLAIKYFNYAVGKDYEKELANNINNKIQEFKIPDSEIHIGKKNKFKDYYIPYSIKNELTDIVTESFFNIKNNRTLNEEFKLLSEDSQNKHPLYIVLSFTFTAFDKIIQKKVKFAHACLSLDKSLHEMYSFNADNKINKRGGFSIEDINNYTRISDESYINVFAIFLNDSQYKIVTDYLEDLKNNVTKTRYNFKHIIDIILRKTEKNSNKYKMICSEFVYTVMKMIGLNILNKPANLVSPDDLTVLSSIQNENIYQIYEGKVIDYNPDKINVSSKFVLNEYYENFLNEMKKEQNSLIHLSLKNLDDKILTPKIPDNYFTKNNYEDNTTPRICFAPTINQCLMGLSQKCSNLELYVHIPKEEEKLNIYYPTIEEVPDVEITNEIWVKNSVKLKCIGKIKVIKDKGLDGHKFSYGNGQEAELYDWDWEWIEKYEEILDEGIGLKILGAVAVLLAGDAIIEGRLNKKAEEALPMALDDYANIKKIPKVNEFTFKHKIDKEYLLKNPKLKAILEKYYKMKKEESIIKEFNNIITLSYIYEYKGKPILFLEFTKTWKRFYFIEESYSNEKSYFDAIAYLKIPDYKKYTNCRGFINEYKKIKKIKTEDLDNLFLLNEDDETKRTVLELALGSLNQRVKIDFEKKEFIIKGIDFVKFILRLKEMYKSRGIEKLFHKNYSWWSLMLWDKEKINKKDMKIVDLRCPLFFALEIYKMFLDLGEFYGLSYYKSVSKKIYNKTWISNYEKRENVSVDTTPLNNLKFLPKDYQLNFIKEYPTLKYIYDLEGYILSFDQGLGKTFTSIGLTEVLHKDQIVIVCPNTLKENWAYEIKQYFSKYDNEDIWKNDVYVFGNSKFNRSKNPKYIIVNQESIQKIYPIINKNKNSMIIVDESHNFRNMQSDRTIKLFKLKELLNCKDNLLMSGTPIKATPDEIIPALRMIDPYFTKELALTYKNAFNANRTEISRVVKERFNRTIYRKTKQEVLSLPNKNVENLFYRIPNEKKYYLSTLKEEVYILFDKYYLEQIEPFDSYKEEFIQLIKQYSTAPSNLTKEYLKYIYHEAINNGLQVHERRIEIYKTFLDDYVYNNPKLTEVDRKRIEFLVVNYIHAFNVAMGKAVGAILPPARTQCYIDIFNNNKNDIYKRINNNPKKTIIFTAFLGVANHIYETMKKDKIGCVKIIGDTKNRMDIINEFKMSDGIDVLIATTQTLSTGVTLTEANQMFFFGTPYRSADFSQACDRIYRIGQTTDVNIYCVYLESLEKNITTRMKQILEWSGEMFGSIIDDDISLMNENASNRISHYLNILQDSCASVAPCVTVQDNITTYPLLNTLKKNNNPIDLNTDLVMNEALENKNSINDYKRLELNPDLVERYSGICPFLNKIENKEKTSGSIFLNSKNNPVMIITIENKNLNLSTEYQYNGKVLTNLWIDTETLKENYYYPTKLFNIACKDYCINFIKKNNEVIPNSVYNNIENSGFKLITIDNEEYYTNIKELFESYNISPSVSLINDEYTKEFATSHYGTTNGCYDTMGLWNPKVYPYGDNDEKAYRERVECLIFDEDMNRILIFNNLKYNKIPGGGTKFDKSLLEQLIAECQEEVRANIKEIMYVGAYLKDFIGSNDRECNLLDGKNYIGSLTHLFVAKYESRYTGLINSKDKDSLLSTASFQKFGDLSQNFKPEWNIGLLMYFKNNSNIDVDNYINNFQNKTLKTDFISLRDDIIDISWIEFKEGFKNKKILTEASSMKVFSKKKRKEIEDLIYGFFNTIDKTGKNTEKYKEVYSKMTDEEFTNYFRNFIQNDKEDFYLEILPNINEPNLKDIKESADFLDLELDEYIYYRHDGDIDNPVRSAYRVPTGYQRIDRLQQTLSHKNTYSFDINQRNTKTGSLTGDSRIARITDQETFSLSAINADKALEEFLSARADNMEKKFDMYKEISLYGYTYLKDLRQDTKGQALKTAEIYLKSAQLKSDL